MMVEDRPAYFRFRLDPCSVVLTSFVEVSQLSFSWLTPRM